MIISFNVECGFELKKEAIDSWDNLLSGVFDKIFRNRSEAS
jgi:hypothetical protein